MRPLGLLKCIARAAVKGLGHAVGFGGLVDLAAEAMKDWNRAADEADRKAELEAVVKMAAAEFRKQVEAVVQEVAADKPPAVQQQLSAYLEQLPDLARKQFARPEDPAGQSVPPGFRLDQRTLAALLPSSAPTRPPATEDDEEPTPSPADLPRVTLQYTAGPLAGQEAVYTEPTILLFGRATDCTPPLPQASCWRVSRRHCFLEVHPPDVRIRDLGSLHGTFIGGKLIGKRPKGEEPNAKFQSPEHTLADGAEVRLSDRGQVAFTIRAFSPPRIAAQRCAQCGREVAEPGADRPGAFICADCRRHATTVVRNAVGSAQVAGAGPGGIHNYELVEALGQGGMGSVHLARHKSTGAVAAIKVMLPKVAASERAVFLFQREIRNTIVLNHRNVVRCLDHGFNKGAFFLVLEYCDGGSVDKLIAQRGGKLPVDEAVEITMQALDGLEYAHTTPIPSVRKKDGTYGPGVGLVHRDIKPANLFLTGWGSGRVVQIGDYGLAKAFEESGITGGTRTGDFPCGTPKYMCRKQVIGYKDAGPEVDVWSLAASFYTMLTGEAPRSFPEGMDPWLAILENDAVPILQRNPKLPKPLARVIDRALREEPAIPFQSAAEFKRALEDATE